MDMQRAILSFSIGLEMKSCAAHFSFEVQLGAGLAAHLTACMYLSALAGCALGTRTPVADCDAWPMRGQAFLRFDSGLDTKPSMHGHAEHIFFLLQLG